MSNVRTELDRGIQRADRACYGVFNFRTELMRAVFKYQTKLVKVQFEHHPFSSLSSKNDGSSCVRQASLHKHNTKTPTNTQIVPTLRKTRKEDRKK